MKNMLIYYGWLNSYDSGNNSWNNEKVAQALAKFDILVFGDGLAASTHGDYSNTKVIIPRIQELNPNAKIFGYTTVSQTYANYKTEVDEWDNTDFKVDGVFLDEAGYGDPNATSGNNGRIPFNDKVDYAHSKGFLVFANAWKPDHILDTTNDTSYPNSTWNPDGIESNLNSDDWYLLESFAIDSNENYESATQWKDRGEKANEYDINIAACSVIGDGATDGQDRFDFIYTSALMHGLSAVGSSDTSYGASSAKSKMWARPDVSRLVDNSGSISSDGNKYFKYNQGNRLELDFSSGSESSTIEVY